MLHERIKELRKQADLTQTQFATLVGVHYQTVFKWEHGLNKPDLSLLGIIADALRCSLDNLLEVENPTDYTGEFDLYKMGAIISELRGQKGLSQTDFAERLQTTPDRVSKWERGIICPSVDALLAIAQIFGVTPAQIYYAVPLLPQAPQPEESAPSDNGETKKTVRKKEGIRGFTFVLLCCTLAATVAFVISMAVLHSPQNSPSVFPSLPPILSAEESALPSIEQSLFPSVEESISSSVEPTDEPSLDPTVEPSIEPSVKDSVEPSIEPSVEPTLDPTVEPSIEPTVIPSAEMQNWSQGLTFSQNTDGTYTVSGIGSCGDSDVVIPAIYSGKTVTAIGKNAFQNNETLVSVVIPEGVTQIGEAAFNNCANLVSVSLPRTLTDIGMGAFRFTALESLSLPENLKTIGNFAFGGEDTTYTEVVLPDSVISVGNGAFHQSPKLKKVVIGKGVAVISENAFCLCPSLEQIILPSSVKTIAFNAFSQCTALKKVYYYGTEAEWNTLVANAVDTGNTCLTNATRYYYSETQPTASGNYWYFDDDKTPAIWL